MKTGILQPSIVTKVRVSCCYLLCLALLCAALFLQGPPPAESLNHMASSSDSASFQPLIFEYSRSSDSRKRSQRVLVAENATVTYEGRTFGEDVGSSKGLYKYALGVYNRKRRRLQVIPFENDGAAVGLQLTGVRSHVTGLAAAGVGASISGGLTGLDLRERRDVVIADFGSRKKQKMETTRKANIVDVTAIASAGDVAMSLKENSSRIAITEGGSREGGENASASASSSSSSSSSAATKSDAALMAARRATLPYFDLTATEPKLIFPLEGVAGGEGGGDALLPSSLHSILDSFLGLDSLLVALRDHREGGGEKSSSSSSSSSQLLDEHGASELAYAASRGGGHFVRSRFQHYFSKLPGDLESARSSQGGGQEDEEGGAGGKKKRGGKKHNQLLAAESNSTSSSSSSSSSSSARATPLHPSLAATVEKLRCTLLIKWMIEIFNGPRDLKFAVLGLSRNSAGTAPPSTTDEGGKASLSSSSSSSSSSSTDLLAAIEAEKGTAVAGEGDEAYIGIPSLRYVPESVLSHLLSKFSDEVELEGGGERKSSYSLTTVAAAASAGLSLPRFSHTLTAAHRDKLRAHIVVLALHAADGASFSMDTGGLATDLKTTSSKLAAIFREVGCRTKPVRVALEDSSVGAALVQDGDEGEEEDEEEEVHEGKASKKKASVTSYIATLVAPLVFPKPKLMRR